MTYSNFARKKGSKDRGKRAAKRVGAAVGGAALLAGAYGLSKRPNLGALGKKVADKIKSGAKDGAEIATAAGGAAKTIAKNQYDKAKVINTIRGKVAKARVGQALDAVKSTAKKAKSKAGNTWKQAKRKGYEVMGNKKNPVF